ncbi:ARM repeat-containing protein [Athelia psychrophila]|uniref:ARM repeat-containing protein n=1 Tax=Athelia psychrophila TaxID=1759441 RepID=A0A166GVU1_9AGAM|nr:ARM repeat-containing protein [Fibularhizoctonia sp. CBS 109695]
MKFISPTGENSLAFLTTVKLLADLLDVLPWASGAICTKTTISAVINMSRSLIHADPAAYALNSLAGCNRYTASLIIECGAVPILVEMLQESDIEPGPAVMALASLLPYLSEDITHISKSDIIKRLVHVLQGRDAREAAFVMGHIAKKDELREAVLQSEGVISTLRGMLGGAASDAAAYAIGKLSEDDSILKDPRKHDVVTVLIRLLDSEDSALASGEALGKLARNLEVRTHIIEVVPELVKKLRVEQEGICEARQAALLSLIGLAQNDTLRGHMISQSLVIVQALVEMLDGPHAEDAANALVWLSENDDARKQIVQLNAIPAIIHMLEGSGGSYAATILMNLGSEETDQFVLDSGMIPALVATLQRSGARSANTALCQLASREVLRNCIVGCNAVKLLVTMLDGPLAPEVTATLCWLTENEVAITEIFNSNVVPALVKLLKNNEFDTQALIILMTVCAKEAAARAEFIQLNAIPAVLGLVNKAPSEAQTLLLALAHDDASIASDVVSKLAKMQKNKDTREWATHTLKLFRRR